MKTMILVLALLALAAPGVAQMQNFYAGGVSYQPGASPAVAGTGLYARLIAGEGTYAFGVLDALPASLRPFSVSTQVGGGIAQKLATLGGVQIYVPTSAGISWNGKNTGWAWSTGGMAVVSIKGSWKVCPNVRALKSSVSGGSDYQVIFGVLLGYGR